MYKSVLIILLLVSSFTIYSQEEIRFDLSLSSHNASSFYDRDNYVVVGYSDQGMVEHSIEVRGLARIVSNDLFRIVEMGIRPSAYDLESDWQRGRIIFSIEGRTEEEDLKFGCYEFIDNQWVMKDYSSLIPEGYSVGEANITDLDGEGRFAISVFKQGRIFEDQNCAILIIQSVDEGLVLLSTIENTCDRDYTDLALTYTENFERVISSCRVYSGTEGIPKGRIITYQKNDTSGYSAIDTLYSPYSTVPFGTFIECHNDRLYVSSSEIKSFSSSDNHWNYSLDVYKWVSDHWLLENNIYSFESLLTFGNSLPRHQLIDIENDIMAYTTFEDGLARFHVVKLKDIKDVDHLNNAIHETKLFLDWRIPTVDLSVDGSELLISGYYDNQSYLCGIFDTNITSTKEEDLQITNPLKNTIFLDKLTLKDGFPPQKLSLYNLSGQLLVSSQLDSELDGLGILPSGMYVLVVGQKEERRLFKVVKL